MTQRNIQFYSHVNNPHMCFSNFFDRKVTYNGHIFPTSEHAFQAQKFIGTPKFDEIKNAPNPTLAKKLGGDRNTKLRPDWEKVKDNIMEEIVLAKFSQHDDLKAVLLNTQTATLTEHTKNDSYWADGGDGSGKNMLGKVLMKVRDQLTKKPLPLQVTQKCGQLRNGRIVYKAKAAPIHVPSFKDFTSIFVMIRDDPSANEYGALSPYSIRVPVKGYPLGVIHENYWQFSKVYPRVPVITQTASTHNSKIVWDYPAEQHLSENDEILPEWYNWNKKGFNCQDYVRFPVGSHPKRRSSCKFSLMVSPDGSIDPTVRFDYVNARKQIYCSAYCANIINHPLYKELLQRYMGGENLLILEVDGPHQESAQYYHDEYDWDINEIQNGTILSTPKNLRTLINDTKHPFGHGYCLSMALSGIEAMKYVVSPAK